MLQITEDTPPDMLAGAMDLTVHLPTGRTVKMAVERSTPMMDLLVQITTNQHLQHSGYTLQALGMAPSAEHSDKILPYKPNTPIGALDTQHIKVIPKIRTIPVPKNLAPGQQPFESTFRLKVHLPRNQLYVTRVSRNVLLEDIMKKVCEEKNLDPMKYEFKHPGNLDEILDPKLTLSDYQITEIYVVLKGSSSLNQAFSTNDIMALKKEEERKQLHNKTGGGVFNLIFRRGKSSMGSGSLSSENRSISPSHSDDSRSVTPPAVQQQIITPPPKPEQPVEQPKPPQRKRRPAPKPPQNVSRKNSQEKPPSNISENSNHSSNVEMRKNVENGLTICHSRNSSDSSGYHEASILSDNCNTSLPRRPKSVAVLNGDLDKLSGKHSQSTSNLSKMSSHSKSTSSLGFAGRKKKAAPPPPPSTTVLKSANSVTNLEKPSPVVASQPSVEEQESPNEQQELVVKVTVPPPKPAPRVRKAPLPKARPRSLVVMGSEEKPRIVPRRRLNSDRECDDFSETSSLMSIPEPSNDKEDNLDSLPTTSDASLISNSSYVQPKAKEDNPDDNLPVTSDTSLLSIQSFTETGNKENNPDKLPKRSTASLISTSSMAETDISLGVEEAQFTEALNNNVTQPASLTSEQREELECIQILEKSIESIDKEDNSSLELPKDIGVITGIATSTPIKYEMPKSKSLSDLETHKNENKIKVKPPEIVGVIPKAKTKQYVTKFDTFGKKSRFKIGNSLLSHHFDPETSSIQSKRSTSSADFSGSGLENDEEDDIGAINDDIFSVSESKDCKDTKQPASNQLFGIHGYRDDGMEKENSLLSLRSISSVPSFFGGNMKKWNGVEGLDDISILSSQGGQDKWVIGDTSDSESIVSSRLTQPTPFDSITSIQSSRTNKDFSISSAEIPRQPDSISSTTNKESIENIIIPAPAEVNGDPNVTSNASETEKPVKEVSKETKVETEKPKEVEDKFKPITAEVEETVDHPIINGVGEEPIANNESEDWQYQLPSPPKAFRDSSPTNFTDVTNYESVTDFKTDSVVTSPELFEKLKAIEDNQSDKITVVSDLPSVMSEEDKPILNTLSLENLEKRRSLVYNRELATSLKLSQSPPKDNTPSDTFSNSITTFENTLDEVRRSSLTKEQTETKITTTKVKAKSSSTLPNFKITTYDIPKQNIKVYEDDTVRSNETANKRNSFVDPNRTSDLVKSFMGRSMENISFRKNSLNNMDEDVLHRRDDFKLGRPQSNNIPKNSYGPSSSIFRSESFSVDQQWSPSKPVSRSKSHLSINKFKDDKPMTLPSESMSKSNSLYDVSGLQSLGVMKQIQNKLKTPTGSMENLSYSHKMQQSRQEPQINTEVNKVDTKMENQQIPAPEEKPNLPPKVKRYRPPSINMGTWSERPKLPVVVKADSDYKQNISSKLIVNTTNNNITSNNSIEIKNTSTTTISPSTYNNNDEVNVRVNSFMDQPDSTNVSIKVNGSEPISSQNTGNVVIKIGNSQPSKTIDNQRFISHTTAAGYARRPFSNINQQQRPRSIAFGSDFDLSRVPVVTSVELKKPYKDMQNNNNTSVTQIFQGNNNFKSSTLNRNSFNNNFSEPVPESKKFSSIYCSTETLPTTNGFVNHNNNNINNKHSENDTFVRPNSFGAPVVRGLKPNTEKQNRFSWSSSNTYHTLPSKPLQNNKVEKESYTTNRDVPFSQSNLRRTDSNRILTADKNLHLKRSPENEATQKSVELNNEKNKSLNSLSQVNNKVIQPPPPPPDMPKVTLKKAPRQIEPVVDPRDQLLSAIRNFGGKKGLKKV